MLCGVLPRLSTIPTLYVRDVEDPSVITRTVDVESRWVIDGEGEAYRTYEGEQVRFDGTRWWVQRELVAAQHRLEFFEELVRDAPGRRALGWVPMQWAPSALTLVRALRQALEPYLIEPLHDDFPEACAFGSDWRSLVGPSWGPQIRPGAFVLCGPAAAGNPHGLEGHVLHRHDDEPPLGELDPGREFEDIMGWLLVRGAGGIRWKHSDGRQAQVTTADARAWMLAGQRQPVGSAGLPVPAPVGGPLWSLAGTAVQVCRATPVRQEGGLYLAGPLPGGGFVVLEPPHLTATWWPDREGALRHLDEL